jgi:ribonuclease HI
MTTQGFRRSTYLIYTDGACCPNPGDGAAAVVIKSSQGRVLHEFVKVYPNTTNNRMELLAAIGALKACHHDCNIVIYTDSQYVQRGITEWIHGWKDRDWFGLKNSDLWKELDAEVSRRCGTIQWHWCRSHSGNPGNERADALATSALNAYRNMTGYHDDHP